MGLQTREHGLGSPGVHWVTAVWTEGAGAGEEVPCYPGCWWGVVQLAQGACLMPTNTPGTNILKGRAGWQVGGASSLWRPGAWMHRMSPSAPPHKQGTVWCVRVSASLEYSQPPQAGRPEPSSLLMMCPVLGPRTPHVLPRYWLRSRAGPRDVRLEE